MFSKVSKTTLFPVTNFSKTFPQEATKTTLGICVEHWDLFSTSMTLEYETINDLLN